MQHPVVDEIRALELVTERARQQSRRWLPPFWIELADGQWRITAEGCDCLTVDLEAGTVHDPMAEGIDAVAAFRIAREYAQSHELRWKPSFSIGYQDGSWQVGACQAQLGGQVDIYVSRDGQVLRHFVNPK